MNAIERLAQLPDGADLYRGPTGQFACGWSRSDVLRFGVWFESEEAARMSWEMSDKRPPRVKGLMQSAEFSSAIRAGLSDVFSEWYA